MGILPTEKKMAAIFFFWQPFFLPAAKFFLAANYGMTRPKFVLTALVVTAAIYVISHFHRWSNKL